MTKQKFNKFMTCLVSDKKLRRFMKELIACGVLEIIHPPVKLQLVDSDGVYMVRILDNGDVYLLEPSRIDGNMLQEVKQEFDIFCKEPERQPERQPERRFNPYERYFKDHM